jgi:CHAT domain-containing protein
VIDPIDSLISDKRLLVAADGALLYVPFSVLPARTGDSREPLIATREVVSVPSLSVLALQRASARPRAAPKTLAVFADPVFERSDPRLSRLDVTQIALEPEVHGLVARSSLLPCADCALRGSAVRSLGRLAASGAEASAIAELVPRDSRLLQSGFDAARTKVLGLDLSQYRIVHFATHGLVDSRYPALSALALSSFDENGAPQNGFLRLDDIYNMNLNADLVVLSACETALGAEIRGEGLIGLTQGFMYAGAKSLVVSLWQVPDGATAQLMIRFYGFMLRDGQRPALALRNAQLSVARERRWRDPFYWSAFTVLGDWR